jgi:adenylate cyclase
MLKLRTYILIQSMVLSLKRFYKRFVALIYGLQDPSEERLGKAILGLLVFTESLICAIWIFVISDLGEGYAFMAFFPYAYLVISYSSLLLFYHFKRFEYFTFTQFVMLLVMPFFMQWIIGGFAASSGIAIWGLLAPMGALMILGARQSTPWFLFFFVLTTGSWFMNDLFSSYALPIPKHTQSLFSMINMAGLCIIPYFLMHYFVTQKERLMAELDQKNSQLEIEQDRSDRLLLNVLPKSVADRLKQNQHRIADRFDAVTILFADLVDFTRMSAGMSPDDLINLLSQVFSRFDELTEKYGVEKIKTIGDAYMVVSGAPDAREDHAEAIANLAIEMQQVLAELSIATGKTLMMRIGINSGPVIAGVIGNTKFSYDMWGDTVNMASRMEQYGLSNVIQVTENTYQLLGDKFRFEKREPIMVKGKGEVQSYFLIGKLVSNVSRVQ